MMEHSIHVFFTSAKQFCSFLQEWVINHWSAPELIAILMELYRYVLKLPAETAIIPEESDKKLQKVRLGEEKPFAGRVKFDPDYPFLYFGQLDPFQDDKDSCQASLAVDLGDIYDDLEPGVMM